ncbi:hypothetical protein [Clavibacter zhangzhiyongii]|uniref:hypothetical protein n=1 Tax=Clavibacter zhangzhiyongii TaxID=2768071 RepID=UPI0019596670|nr:hypothetical protein [Clavibacter zhangzhiyongii]
MQLDSSRVEGLYRHAPLRLDAQIPTGMQRSRYCERMPAEATQEQGRIGVAQVQRWLEATTHLELPWNVYETPEMCEVQHFGGAKFFDMSGQFLGKNKRLVYVENKNYTSDGGQYGQFQEFLAIAYSSTAKHIQNGLDRKAEFLWVTSHPFSLTRWSKLATHTEVRKALNDHPSFLGDEPIDDDLLRTVADRIWVLVMNQRQVDISLTQEELWQVLPILKRKASTL